MTIDYYLLEKDRFTVSIITKHPIRSANSPISIPLSEHFEFYPYDEIFQLIAAHNIPVLSINNLFEIRRAGHFSDLSYDIHTGRELLMMIEGAKPLSVFSKYTWEEFDPYGGQRFDELHKHFGIQKHVHLQPDGYMNIFFCLPGEEWRISAYLSMRNEMKTNGHSAALERTEGELLGYTKEQCDEYMACWNFRNSQ
jgi:hypothetical protein